MNMWTYRESFLFARLLKIVWGRFVIVQLVGIDLVENERIKKVINKHGNFLSRVFGLFEQEQLRSKNFRVESVAGNFCAKEAFLKAIGKGISGVNLKDIEILKDKNGAPYIKLSKKVVCALKLENFCFSVSITHTKHYASAVVICYSSKN